MSFHTTDELSALVRAELEHIRASPSAQRSSTDAAYLAARADYDVDNRVIERDADNNILRASGNTVPSRRPGGLRQGRNLPRTGRGRRNGCHPYQQRNKRLVRLCDATSWHRWLYLAGEYRPIQPC